MTKTGLTDVPQYGASPDPGPEPVDIENVYHLPRLRDAPYGPLAGFLSHLKMTRRTTDLDLIGRSALRAWQNSPELAKLSANLEIKPRFQLEFRGEKASDLNRLIAEKGYHCLRVISAQIDVDEPIHISGSDIRIDFGSTALRGSSLLPYLLRIENADGVDVRGGVFLAGDSGILIDHSRRIRISNIGIAGLGGAGIVITDSRSVAVHGTRISGLKYAGIVVHKGVTGSLIEENRIEDNSGTSDLAAGILLTDREVNLAAGSRTLYGSQSYDVPQALAIRRHPPDGNLILSNQLVHNEAGGIYSDGGVRNVISSNLIAGNGKEGICLDNASISNVVVGNVVRRNGSRWGEPDRVLAMEAIVKAGKLHDGTPAAKLPGISLDNALYSIIFQNTIENNYGGGIKLVRSGLFSIIGMNTLIENAAANSDQSHIFGIELGAARGDFTTSELDIAPSRGNIVFSNLVRGAHYAGIFFGKGSDQNDVFDNIVMDATAWALESVSPMPNFTLNNLTNLPSRNIEPGFDPNLFARSHAVMDVEARTPELKAP